MNKEEKKYLLLTYGVIGVSTLIIATVLVGFLFSDSRYIKPILFAFGYILGFALFGILAFREFLYGKKLNLGIYSLISFIWLMIAVIYIYISFMR